ncbi:MAG: hypothetical protein ACM3PY_15945 [Omnitrophica WOR_2 bacterium]
MIAAAILAMITGVFLIWGSTGRFPGSKSLAGSMRAVETALGIIDLIFGIIYITTVIGIALLISGLVLAAWVLSLIPGIGEELSRAGQALGNFRIVIGLIVLLIGFVVFLERALGIRVF